MNQTLAPIRDAHHLPGMIGAILIGESLASIGAVGIRKIGSTEPMQVLDQVHLGSCGKAMTATMIGMIVDDGLLTWSSRVADVFPESASRLHRDFQSVTLWHLLTHRAGLPHDANWWALPGVTTTDQRRAAMLSLLGAAPLSRPGTTYTYSNAGYAIAGLMAEQITGLSWEALMKERVFDPLEMSSAGFGSPGRSGPSSGSSRVDQPWGHRENHGRAEANRQDNAPCMGPAGTIHCTVPDWAKFAALHLRGGRGKTRLLKPATLQILHTPPTGQEYAGGWLVVDRSWAGGKALNHNGSNTSWYVSIWIAPAREFATMVATNQGGNAAEAACEEASIELIKAVEFLPRPRGGRGRS
jgi:CubicO group peptidase (beta-lactamase class C family)